MKALVLGIIILAAAVFMVLPSTLAGFGLGWWDDMLAFLRGALPVIAALIALLAIFIGVADIKDRAEAKKEESAAGEEAKEE
ncbi:MAG: hypothetical protein LBS06_03860 [Treponema sp.]|nr:hypothetical protein [Treponema sp.]